MLDDRLYCRKPRGSTRDGVDSPRIPGNVALPDHVVRGARHIPTAPARHTGAEERIGSSDIGVDYPIVSSARLTMPDGEHDVSNLYACFHFECDFQIDEHRSS